MNMTLERPVLPVAQAGESQPSPVSPRVVWCPRICDMAADLMDNFGLAPHDEVNIAVGREVELRKAGR